MEGKVSIFSLPELRQGHCVQELKECLTQHGLFYLQGSGLLEADHEPIQAVTLQFFKGANEEDKFRVSNKFPGIRRGHTKLESESTARVTGSGNYTDYSECYSMGTSDNLFPSQEFETVWNSYFAKMNKVSLEVASVILGVMDVAEKDKLAVLGDCDPVFRFRHYPDVTQERCAESQPLRMASHYDLSIVTLIHQTPCVNGFVSLQYDPRGNGSQLIDLPSMPDTLLVMCGSVATLVTNGRVKAPKHQVIAPASHQRIGSARTSAVFFLRPNPGFEFSTASAKACGLNICVKGDKMATFKEWIGGNYNDLSKQSN